MSVAVLVFRNTKPFYGDTSDCCCYRQCSLLSLLLVHRLSFDIWLEVSLTRATSRRTTHILQIYSTYLTYRDKANGRNPYFNDEIVRSFEDALRRGPQGPIKADVLGWLARACRERGERASAETYMLELIDFFLHDPSYRDSSAKNCMDDLEMWFIEWGEAQKAAELARWREEELSQGVTAKIECYAGN